MYQHELEEEHRLLALELINASTVLMKCADTFQTPSFADVAADCLTVANTLTPPRHPQPIDL